MVLAYPTPQERGPLGRVAFLAGTKLGSAVIRNRTKRLLREAVRAAGGPWPEWDVVVLARPAALRTPVQEIAGDLRKRLDSLGVTS